MNAMKGLSLFVLGGFCGAAAMLFVLAPQRPVTHVAPRAMAPPATGAISTPSTMPPASTAASVPAPGAPSPRPSTTATPSTGTEATALAATDAATSADLMIPVEGIRPGALTDTFDDARAAGRIHDAIDIMAPKGTRVLAVADGKVAKLFTSVRGGLTVYEFDPTETYVYYYAHLDGYADGIVEGRQLRRGDPVGFVGSTGDASPAAPHLHFEVSLLGPEKHWWQATSINPYPILTGRQSLAAAAEASAAASKNH